MAKKKRRVVRKKPQSIISDDIFLPNHSGMLDAGKVHRTPTDDLDPVNKKYVDDNNYWLLNGNKIYYNDGNVGIGTNNPLAPIHVYSTTASVGPVMQTTFAGGEAKMVFWNVNKVFHVGNISDAFQIVDNVTTRFSIDGSGNAKIYDGTLDMNTHKIIGVVDPTTNQEVATKKYVDDNAFSSPLTTKGDIFTYDTADARLPVGTDGQVLVADSGETEGIKWSSFLGSTVESQTFDITANTSIVAAAGAGIKIKVVGISMHNNDSTGTDDTPVQITDGNGGTDLYGGATGHIYLTGRGGVFVLPIQVDAPYFETTANTALYINPTASKRVSGIVYYVEEA